MKLHQMSRPLNNDTARCVGEICDKKNICQRYLTIEIDNTDPYKWFMDASIELNGDDTNCDFFIEWGV